MDKEASIHESHRTGANKEAILNWPSLRDSAQREQTKKKKPVFHPERGILKVPPGAQASNLVGLQGLTAVLPRDQGSGQTYLPLSPFSLLQ